MKIIKTTDDDKQASLILNGKELFELLPLEFIETLPEDFEEEDFQLGVKNAYVISAPLEEIENTKEAMRKALNSI